MFFNGAWHHLPTCYNIKISGGSEGNTEENCTLCMQLLPHDSNHRQVLSRAICKETREPSTHSTIVSLLPDEDKQPLQSKDHINPKFPTFLGN